MVLAVDITKWDIYQCDREDVAQLVSTTPQHQHHLLIDQFAGSHKCHKDTNDVHINSKL